jgi:hypothetical protein
MYYTIDATANTVKVTCTFEDLVRMANGAILYATPTPDGLANQVYLASQPQWKYDFCLATLQGFNESEGYDITAGWEGLDDLTAHEDVYTLTVPRARQDREA